MEGQHSAGQAGGKATIMQTLSLLSLPRPSPSAHHFPLPGNSCSTDCAAAVGVLRRPLQCACFRVPSETLHPISLGETRPTGRQHVSTALWFC